MSATVEPLADNARNYASNRFLDCGEQLEEINTTGNSMRNRSSLDMSKVERDLKAWLESNDDLLRELDAQALESVLKRRRESTDIIVSIDSQIMRLRAQIDVLESRRRCMKDVLKKCQLISRPAQDLPHDILACIFDFFAMLDCPNLTFKRPPWVLGWICCRWRFLALALPRLWTVFDTTQRLLSSDLLVKSVVMQLYRCQEQPIQIILDNISTELGDVIPEEVLPILSANNRTSSWSHLSMEMGDNIDRAFSLLEPYAGLFGGLQSLKLDIIGVDHPDISLFQDGPALTTFIILGEHRPADSIKLPWHQIIHHTAQDSDAFYTTNFYHFSMLPRLGNLQTCWLDCFILDDEKSAADPPHSIASPAHSDSQLPRTAYHTQRSF